jgi:hypothetical protein
LGQFALLRCSLEIDALCKRCQLAEERKHAQRSHHTNVRLLESPRRNLRAGGKEATQEANF